MNGNADDHLWSLLEKSLEKRDSCYKEHYIHICIGTLLSSKTYKKKYILPGIWWLLKM